VTCFGDYLVAAKLNSQVHRDGKIDWRAIPSGELEVEPYYLPDSLAQNIRKFMKKMGLVFGSMDFIVNEDHEYIFLEVNEQGQFLWIEELNNDFQMLDIFINFLINKSSSFQWDAKNTQHSIELYRNKMVNMMKQNLQRHVDLNCSIARVA
jgi:glutathione synthase/RimK-type ligase-like ATP-grasp enzyme